MQGSAQTSKPFSTSGEGRGAISKQYHTRSMSKNIYQDYQNTQHNLDTSMPENPGRNIKATCQKMSTQIDYT